MNTTSLMNEWLKKNKVTRLQADPRLSDNVTKEMDLLRKAYRAEKFLKRRARG